MTPKPTHGGARKGAGRKTIAKVRSVSICLTEAEKSKLDKLAAKAGVARGVIVARMMKMTTGGK
jgi:hypothetical protein